jgi:CxxC motif-containing protein (DUF1111 family)
MSQQIQLSRLGLFATALILAPVLFELAGIAAADVSSQPAVGVSKSVDPGVRPLPVAAGGALPGLGADEKAFFDAAKVVFMEIDTVPGGLGPRFNLDSCAGCHAFPAVGGSSPTPNPQVTVATAPNVVPSFISKKGPVREARFVHNRDGTPDGGVHDLFVITGRADAPGCNIQQPEFARELANNNVVFRIPTPLFGLGLVENIPDNYLQDALAADTALKQSLGISGSFNRSGNDGTITRFGWKAQNKSLLVFAGEAYNVEQGVTNELFPNKRETEPSCLYNGLPEDATKLTPKITSGSSASDYASDVVNFAGFMRFLAPPTPAPDTTSTVRGSKVFQNIGCHLCHIMQQTTGRSGYTSQNNVTFFPFSDFALHDMGKGLADGVSQGNANGREFRTAPLWGVGQRIFFLHDGRTSDLYQAIMDHASDGSEANAVISNFRLLSPTDKQDMLNFLRSL